MLSDRLFLGYIKYSVLTRVQQVRILIAQNLVGQEILSIPVERQERHHVVPIIVAYGGIGSWVAGPGWLVCSEPTLKDAAGWRDKKNTSEGDWRQNA